MVRRIAHIDLDAFFVSVEIVKNPALKGLPVIVGGTGPRGVVSSCSYQARKMGVRSAMPGFKAKALCPNGIFISGSMADYSAYSRKVADIITHRIPLVEQASIDEFYLDLTGMERYFEPFKLLQQLKNEIICETGLPISFALATNKLISKIATNEVKPNGIIEVLPGTEQAYLAPLSITKMPGLGAKSEAVLRKQGIQTMADIVLTDPVHLQKWLGKWGAELHLRAQGIDEGIVVNFREQKSISKEITFLENVTDIAILQATLVTLIEKAAANMRHKDKIAGCVAIKLRYNNFDTHTHQHTIPFSQSDTKLIQSAKQLFTQNYKPHEPVRLLGIKLSQLIDCGSQMLLFEEDSTTELKLLKAIDAINNVHGKATVRRAGGL